MQELNFEDINEPSFIDDLNYSCMEYNVEECGMAWADLITLFGEDTVQAAQARYMMMKGCEEN